MATIGITGSNGFLGWHLRAFLHAHGKHSILGTVQKTFQDSQQLQEFVRGADIIVHLAGMNRGKEQDIVEINVGLTSQLIQACQETKSTPHIIFANSSQQGKHIAYERSKRRCTELFQKWANASCSLFTNVVLSNVFGEGGRPFYNSVVSTFCHQLASGERPQVMEDRVLELVHAQQVAQTFADSFNEVQSGEIQVKGAKLSVGEILDKLENIAGAYREQFIPDLSDPLSVNLFNTYRSYLFPTEYPMPIVQKRDPRGSLFEAVKTYNGGQCFLSSTHPGITRGNHYHTRKFERFLVLSGQAVIRLRKLFSQNISEFAVSGDSPEYIDMPTFHTHDITNVGSDTLVTLFWSNEIFDPAYPDTIQEPVIV